MTKTVVELLENILETLVEEKELVAAAHVAAAIDTLKAHSGQSSD